MRKRTDSDIALTALALEAECRRKKRGLARYSYGDLVADLAPGERQRIIDDYKKAMTTGIRGGAERFAEVDDEEDLRAIRKKCGVPEGKNRLPTAEKAIRGQKGQSVTGARGGALL